MKSKENGKKLDERIRSAIGRDNVEFDFDKWKTGHQSQIEQFKASVSKETVAPTKTCLWQIIIKSRGLQIAAAAVIIIATCIFLISYGKNGKIKTQQITKAERAPAELTTFASLNFAYQRGGMEMVEQICDKALKMAGQRPANISMQELFEENNNL